MLLHFVNQRSFDEIAWSIGAMLRVYSETQIDNNLLNAKPYLFKKPELIHKCLNFIQKLNLINMII
jgi:hypothetical protein